MKLRKCLHCKTYTLKENCPKCGSKTKDAHYKFVRVKVSQNI
ncbi:MAG: nucleolar RNA-binding Nop10p family protein [Nanoarchaeota archaeon]